jgi:diacylglycerol kinase (ATP)
LKIVIILNGISLRKKFFYSKIVPALSSHFLVDVWETRGLNDAVVLAAKAVEKQYDVILAAGGDGTLNQVLNGMMQHEKEPLPVLGIIPLGSGNDFARTLNVTPNVPALIARLKAHHYILSDVGKIICTDGDGNNKVAYFINVADAGMGPEVVDKVMKSDRTFGASVSYYKAILSTFVSYKPMPVTIKTDGWEWTGKLRTLAVGNGKFYGHGLCIAPDAKIDDGDFSCFIVGDVSVATFVRYSGTLKRSKKINHPKVCYKVAKQLALSAAQPCMIEADGEPVGYLPATIHILPKRIKVLY